MCCWNQSDLLKNLCEQKKYTHICLVGDFNYGSINWVNWTTSKSEDSLEANFLETLWDFFLFQSVSEPIRNCDTDEPSTLDFILTNEENHVLEKKQLFGTLIWIQLLSG